MKRYTDELKNEVAEFYLKNGQKETLKEYKNIAQISENLRKVAKRIEYFKENDIEEATERLLKKISMIEGI